MQPMTLAPAPTAPPPVSLGERAEANSAPTASMPVAGLQERGKLRRLLGRPGVLLALITLLGTGLRFVSLDQPALWGDEAFTFSRVCGSFRQLLDVLQFDGFMPLHYVVYWWVGQQFELSPFTMRLPVALAGSLMPPAMYFLARQLGISVRTSLVVALFTASSAYMLAYSRDAKMYMPFWLFCATHIACLLWWMDGSNQGQGGRGERAEQTGWIRRLLLAPYHSILAAAVSRSTFRWLCWIAAGCAMVGYHALGLMVVGVELLIFLTHRHLHWRRIVPFVVGLGAMGLLVWGHFGHFTDWDNRVSESWNSSGVQWVNLYNAERTGPDLATFAATAFLMSWEWPVKSWQRDIDPRVLKTLMTVSVGFGILVAGGLVWAVVRRAAGRDAVATPSDVNSSWRPIFWLGAWLLLPAYAIYCKSVPLGKVPYNERSGTLFAAPWTAIGIDLPGSRGEWTDLLATGCATVAHPVPLAVLAVLLAIAVWRLIERNSVRRPGGLLSVILPGAALAAFLCIEYVVLRQMAIAAAGERDGWNSFWMPRYLGALWPAFAIILCASLMNLPTRGLRVSSIALLIAVNLTQFSVRVWGGSEPPTGMMARDIVDAQPLHIRSKQLGLDLTRANFFLATGTGTPRFDRALVQAARLPVVAPTTRTYMQTGIWSPEPGGGVLGSFAMRYYLCHLVGVDADPPSFRRRTALVDRQWFVQSGTSPRLIAGDVKKLPEIQRVVTWDRYGQRRPDAPVRDPIAAALGPGWRLISDDGFAARDHWTWRKKYELRRREYARIAVHATPATPSTPTPSTPPPTTASAGAQ